MELSVAIQAKVEVTPSNWNFGFQPTLSCELCVRFVYICLIYCNYSIFQNQSLPASICFSQPLLRK